MKPQRPKEILSQLSGIGPLVLAKKRPWRFLYEVASIDDEADEKRVQGEAAEKIQSL